MRRPSPSLGVGLSDDIDVASWGGRIVELASVEDALRVHHSARPSPDQAPCELTRLTSRQRLILRGLRWCGHRPARRRPGSLESPVTCHDLRSATLGPRAPRRPGAQTARRDPHRTRDLHPQLADHHHDHGRDRRRAVRLHQHRQEPRRRRLPQTRSHQPPRSHRPRPPTPPHLTDTGPRRLAAQVPRARQVISPPRYDVVEARTRQRCHDGAVRTGR